MDEWNTMVQDAQKDKLTFIDFENKQASFDIVIDTVCHFARFLRRSSHYWKGVKFALKDSGVYIGWNDSKNLDRKERRLHHISAEFIFLMTIRSLFKLATFRVGKTGKIVQMVIRLHR